MLKDNESLDDLQAGGLFLIQKKNAFRFGIDAVLLSAFAEVKKGDRVLDLCTGSGVIPVLLSYKTEASEIYGIEIMPEIAEMAERSVKYNKINNVFIKTGDIKSADKEYGCGCFDVITCNPPYIKDGSGLKNPEDLKKIARHEVLCTLEDVIKTSAKLLKFGGKLCMVHRAERLTDVLSLMRKYKIEPKRLRMIHPSKGKNANLLLVEGALGGGSFLKVLEPLTVYDESGEYTAGIERIYKSER